MKMGWWVVLVASCGGSDPVAPDATMPDAEVVPCNTVENVGEDVNEVGVAEVAPVPAGGTIEDGTYTVTAAVIYTGVGGLTGENGVVYHATSVNDGGAYEFVDTGTNPGVTAGVYETEGVDMITIVSQCPTFGPVGFDRYTATPTELVLFNTTNAAAIATITFTKQP